MAGLGRRKRSELLGLARPEFARPEPWLQAGKYVAAVMSECFRLTLARGVTLTCAQTVRELLADDRRWEVRTAGKGPKGQRRYAWARVAAASPGHSLLIRRHLRTGNSLTTPAISPRASPPR